MKIFEILSPKLKSVEDTRSSITNSESALDVVSDKNFQEGVGQILRRVKGKGLKKGFRCISGPRKGRIVANPSTCTAKLQPKKGAKIRAKRAGKAAATAKKRAMTMRSGGNSKRLKSVQVGQGRRSGLKKSGRLQKSRFI